MDSRRIAGKPGRPGSLTQRAKATLNTPTPVSAAKLAACYATPRARSAPASAEAMTASLACREIWAYGVQR